MFFIATSIATCIYFGCVAQKCDLCGTAAYHIPGIGTCAAYKRSQSVFLWAKMTERRTIHSFLFDPAWFSLVRLGGLFEIWFVFHLQSFSLLRCPPLSLSPLVTSFLLFLHSSKSLFPLSFLLSFRFISSPGLFPSSSLEAAPTQKNSHNEEQHGPATEVLEDNEVQRPPLQTCLCCSGKA